MLFHYLLQEKFEKKDTQKKCEEAHKDFSLFSHSSYCALQVEEEASCSPSFDELIDSQADTNVIQTQSIGMFLLLLSMKQWGYCYHLSLLLYHVRLSIN